MLKFIKTLLNAVQFWTRKEIKAGIKEVPQYLSDWSQNDPTAPDYVKNRTHWEENSLGPIIKEMTVTISEDGGYEKLTETCPKIIPGQTYAVILNGATYECVARLYNDANALIGNGTIYGDGYEANGEPFSCDWYDDGTIYLNAAKSGTYTVSIYGFLTVIHKIDKKFIDMPDLPDNLATTDDLAAVQSTANNKMDKNNPTGNGSFSMNRKPGTTVGTNSHAEGYQTTASSYCAHAEGYYT